jgi:hypothetical protein
MPITSWLRALFSKSPAPEPAPAPPTDAPAHAEYEPHVVDNGVRMHIAAHDPEFPKKRDAAVGTITAAIDVVAQAHGFTKKAKSWAKTGTLGTVSIHLQRSLYGFESYINLGFQPLDGAANGPWAQDDFVHLGMFYAPCTATAGSAAELGTLTYLDVAEDPDSLIQPIEILDKLALPWLLAHLTDPMAHSLPYMPPAANSA